MEERRHRFALQRVVEVRLASRTANLGVSSFVGVRTTMLLLADFFYFAFAFLTLAFFAFVLR
jgi:hypothetical protein